MQSRIGGCVTAAEYSGFVHITAIVLKQHKSAVSLRPTFPCPKSGSRGAET